jgi:hypothetical protein
MSSPQPILNQIALPPSVRALLRRVRFRVRRDAVAAGALLFVCFAVVVFWTTTTLDVSWFRLQRLELPVGLRAILLALILPVSAWLVASRVLFPLVRRVRDTDVALILERRFPQFQDRLITSVESAHGIEGDGPLVRPMLQRSILEADKLAQSVVADEVFNSARLKRLSLSAGGLLLSIVGLGIVQPQLLTRWWSAFVRCEETYYQRTTDVKVVVISQPGDRRIEFQPVDDQFLYRHPRGADLELEMRVPAGGPVEGRLWVVPDRVRVDVIRDDGSRSRTWVSATAASDRTFRFVVTRLQEPISLELLAGDFRTRTPFRVDVVNAPGIDQIHLKCQYPEYTGWNQLRESSIAVTGSEVQLPIGTEFVLTATASKPLRSARIVSDQMEVSGDREAIRIRPRDGQTEQSISQPLIAADGKTLTAKFLIRTPRTAESENSEAAQTTQGESSETDALKTDVLQIPSSTSLRFFLHDDDNVISASPATLRVQGIEDKPPVVVAQMTGIDTAVTRLAQIPITGRIRDDYGLKSAGFEFLVDDESSWRPRPFRTIPATGATEFQLNRNDSEPWEVFDVRPMELSEGQTLTLSVLATDQKPGPAPGVTRSEPMIFRIVSIEELLSLLYTREIALRSRFEEVIAQLEELNNDLQFHQDVAARVDAAAGNSAQEDRISLNTCATRSGNSLRRQANELNAIIEGFETIVRQLINNAIPPQQLAENMRSDIVNPLRFVSSDLIVAADNSVSAFRVAAAEGRSTEPLVLQSRQQVSLVISSLKQILENVRDLAEFHEALRDLKAILDEQQQILDNTKKLQKSQLFDDILNK